MRWYSIFMLFIVSSLYSSELITTNNFEIIEQESKKLNCLSLVLFDVDNTLIFPIDAILRPQAKLLFNQLINDHPERDLYRDIRLKASHSIVDQRFVHLIQGLQEKKIPTLAFTAAFGSVCKNQQPGEWRLKELKLHGFNFYSPFSEHQFLELPKVAEPCQSPIYRSGILYTSLQPKGIILTHFLNAINWYPDKVLFVDDERERVEQVTEALDKMGIECVGIHYTAVEETPCEIILEQAIFQIDYFIENDIWLSDDACKKLYLDAS